MEGDSNGIISRLRKEIAERNVEIRKAAQIGSDLLKQNGLLSEKIELLNSEIEALKQDKYTLQLDLNNKLQIISSQASEIESQRGQCDELARKIDHLGKENLVQKEQITHWERKKSYAETNKETLEQENKVLKSELDVLKNEVKDLKMYAEASENVEEVEESTAEKSVDYYKCLNEELNKALSDLKEELEVVKSSEREEKKSVETLQEILKEKSKQLAACSVEVQEAKDHAAEMQLDVEKLKLEQINQNRRGNSLFGEIDDRRRIYEKEYKVLAKKYEDLRKNYYLIKKELELCQEKMSSMTSRKYHEHHIEILNSQLYKAKDDIQHLSNKVLGLIRNKDTKDEILSNTAHDSFLVAMHQEDKKEIRQLERDMLRLGRHKMADDATISELREKLYESQKKLDDADQKIIKLHHDLREHSMFMNPEESTNQDAEVSIREFDPNQVNSDSNPEKSAKESFNQIAKMESTNQMKKAGCISDMEDTLSKGKTDPEVKFDPKAYIRSTEYKNLKTRYANQCERKQPKDVQCAQQ